MFLLVIRHGELEADILNAHEGRSDFELSERDRRQVETMAEYVADNHKLTKINAGALKRTARTAAHLLKKIKAKIIF